MHSQLRHRAWSKAWVFPLALTAAPFCPHQARSACAQGRNSCAVSDLGFVEPSSLSPTMADSACTRKGIIWRQMDTDMTTKCSLTSHNLYFEDFLRQTQYLRWVFFFFQTFLLLFFETLQTCSTYSILWQRLPQCNYLLCKRTALTACFAYLFHLMPLVLVNVC